jgi:hypothetical protein
MMQRADKGPWTAQFLDGPIADHGYDYHFVVGPPLSEIVFALIEKPWRWWAMVGWDDSIPDPPWSEQVTYRLVSEVAGIDGESVCRYELAGTPT